ncbi:MAG: type IV pilus assembly protein PilM [Patescibacteria group bacterium]
MGLFSSKGNFLGVDIGSSTLKIVELSNYKGQPKLETYGYMEQSHDILKNNGQAAKDKLVNSLKLVCQKARTSTSKAVAALPSYTVFSSVITLPEMSKKELESAIKWEAKKIVPMPLEEMVLDWKILDDFTKSMPDGASSDKAQIKTKAQKQIKILITAAPQNLVTRYIEIFKAAGLELISLETESFALERVLVGHEKVPIMIVDIGAVTTNISVVVASVPLINRSIDLGGQTITKTIANSLNVDIERAEQFKRDFGLNSQNQSTSQIPKRIEFMVSSVVNEIRYVLNLYQNQSQGAIEKIILTGGSSFLPNLTNYLQRTLNTNVFIGDPWARVMYPLDLKPILSEIGPRMSVAIGLAMREIIS